MRRKGPYLVTLVVNQHQRRQYKIAFDRAEDGNALAELTPATLEKAGVNTGVLRAFSGLAV